MVVNYAVYNTLNAVNNDHLLTLLIDPNTVSTIASILVVSYPTAVVQSPVSVSTSGGGNVLSSGNSLTMTPTSSPTTSVTTAAIAQKNYDNYVFIGASVLGGLMLLGIGGSGLYYLKKKREWKKKIKMETEFDVKPSVHLFQEPNSPFAYGHSPVLPNQDPEDDDDDIQWGKYTSRLESIREDEENMGVSIDQKPYSTNRYGTSPGGGDRWQPSSNLWVYDSDDNSSKSSSVNTREHSAEGGFHSPRNFEHDTANPQRLHRSITDAVNKVELTHTFKHMDSLYVLTPYPFSPFITVQPLILFQRWIHPTIKGACLSPQVTTQSIPLPCLLPPRWSHHSLIYRHPKHSMMRLRHIICSPRRIPCMRPMERCCLEGNLSVALHVLSIHLSTHPSNVPYNPPFHTPCDPLYRQG